MMRGKDTFLYFAFGSNMLTQRIHVQNQSAKAVGTAMLKDHELDFRLPSKVCEQSAIYQSALSLELKVVYD